MTTKEDGRHSKGRMRSEDTTLCTRTVSIPRTQLRSESTLPHNLRLLGQKEGQGRSRDRSVVGYLPTDLQSTSIWTVDRSHEIINTFPVNIFTPGKFHQETPQTQE